MKLLQILLLTLFLMVISCAPPEGVTYRGVQQFRRDEGSSQSRAWHQSHTSSSVSASRKKILTTARSCIGTNYRIGGTDRHGFDCSGLVLYSYRESGRALPRTAREQYQSGKRRSLSQIKPGDLVFFNFGSGISHVGIYKGGAVFIHAPSSGGKVREDSLKDTYWKSRFVGAASYL